MDSLIFQNLMEVNGYDPNKISKVSGERNVLLIDIEKTMTIILIDTTPIGLDLVAWKISKVYASNESIKKLYRV